MCVYKIREAARSLLSNNSTNWYFFESALPARKKKWKKIQLGSRIKKWKKKERVESNWIKGIRKSLKRPWRAHLYIATLRILVIIRATQKEEICTLSLYEIIFILSTSHLFPLQHCRKNNNRAKVRLGPSMDNVPVSKSYSVTNIDTGSSFQVLKLPARCLIYGRIIE